MNTERLTVGVWKSRWAFDRFMFKYQYEGTDNWEREFQSLNDKSEMLRPCDLVVDLPLSIQVIYKNYKPQIVESALLDEYELMLSPAEVESGSCSLCRISGSANPKYKGIRSANRKMFILDRNGTKLKKHGREIVGAWYPCVSPIHSKPKKQAYDVL